MHYVNHMNFMRIIVKWSMQFKFRFGFLILVLLFFISFNVMAQSGRSAKTSSRSYGRTGLLFDASMYYGQSEATATPAALNQWQNTTSIYDVRLGYIMDNSVYFGGAYSTRSDNQLSSEMASGGAAALGFGFFADNGFNIRIYYRFNEVYGDYSSGSGYQADLGYMLNMTSNFFLGFSVSVRQSTFKTNNAIVVFDNWTRKETYPFLNVGFLFN